MTKLFAVVVALIACVLIFTPAPPNRPYTWPMTLARVLWGVFLLALAMTVLLQ